MSLVISKQPKDYIVEFIHQRLHKKNKNFIGVFVGPTGAGKSCAALRLAEKIDPDFDERNVCFTAQEFMQLVNGKSKELKKGSVVLWDELQISMGALDFQNFISKSINYILSTFRHRNLCLLLTTPYQSFVNASVRRLIHASFELQSINFREKKSIIKPFFHQVNARSGKIYYKYLRVARGDGTTPAIKRYFLGLPSKKLLDSYEKKKGVFTSNLNEEIMRDINQKVQEKQQGKQLTARQEEVYNHLAQGVKPKEIEEKMGMTSTAVYHFMEAIRKKGYILQKKEDGTYNVSKNG